MRDKWDWWDFVYGEDGKITKVDRCNGGRVWDFAWNGNKCNVTGYKAFNFEVGTNGMISTLNWGDDVYTFTYDANGYMTQSKLGNDVVSTITVANGNITKIVEGENTCEFVYGTEENVNGIQYQYQDEYNKMIPGWYRFLIESGLFGKAPKNVPTSFSYNGTKVCDYAFETETPQEEKDGWKVGVAYIVMKTAHINGSGETKEDIHKYAFEEYK